MTGSRIRKPCYESDCSSRESRRPRFQRRLSKSRNYKEIRQDILRVSDNFASGFLEFEAMYG